MKQILIVGFLLISISALSQTTAELQDYKQQAQTNFLVGYAFTGVSIYLYGQHDFHSGEKGYAGEYGWLSGASALVSVVFLANSYYDYRQFTKGMKRNRLELSPGANGIRIRYTF